MIKEEIYFWDEWGKYLFDYLHDEKMRPVWKSYEAQQDFLTNELEKCQARMVQDEKEMSAFKERLKNDEDEITRLGSSA